MTLRESEALLFAEWKTKRLELYHPDAVPSFYPDGVVNEAAWLGSAPKILLLMKEVNDPGGKGWDLREFLSNTKRPETWDSVTRWIRAIRALPKELPWQEVALVQQEHRRDNLGSLAVMNLKKSPGGHTTKVKSFRAVVEKEQSFLSRQFNLYNADIVICCGSEVTAAFSRWIKPEKKGQWRRTRHGIKFLEYQPGQHVIDFAHPEARVSPFLLHYPLVEAIREIKKFDGDGAVGGLAK